MKTIEHYFRDCIKSGIIDFSIRASIAADGRVTFYIHPDSKDGDTLDFECNGNSLHPNRDVSRPELSRNT